MPSCTPGWAAGPAFPAVGIVRAPGNFFPTNGRFYVVGGRSADTVGSDLTHPVEFNPVTNTWTTMTATLPDANVNNMACGVLTAGGTPQIYCVGGSAAAATGATRANRVFTYNPVTDTTDHAYRRRQLARQSRQAPSFPVDSLSPTTSST